MIWNKTKPVAGALLAVFCAACVYAPSEKAGTAIGVFDSGTGGITVLEQMLTQDVVDNATGAPGADGVPDFAGERFVFFGDSANMSYGVYPAEGRTDYLRELIRHDAEFVLGNRYYRSAADPAPTGRKPRAKIVVIACNTATAYGLADVREMLAGSGIQVVGVVNAGARAALDAVEGAGDCTIGVLATHGTIASGAYERAIREEAAARGRKSGIVVVSQPGYGMSEAVDRVSDFIDDTLSAPRASYKGPAAGSGEGAIDLARLDRYAFDFGGNRMLVRRDDAGRVAEVQINSVDNYVRYNFLSLVERLKASGAKAPLRVVVLGCTHYPYLLDSLSRFAAELRARPEYTGLVADDLTFIDPAVYTARECHRILREKGLLAGRGEMRVDAFVSVPDPSLSPDKIDRDGRLTYKFRYSRHPGDPRGTKEVPLSSRNIDPKNAKRLRDSTPASYGRISGLAAEQPRQ